MVHRKQFTKNLALHLLDEVIKSISVNKASFLCIVPVQIEIERESILRNEMVR